MSEYVMTAGILISHGEEVALFLTSLSQTTFHAARPPCAPGVDNLAQCSIAYEGITAYSFIQRIIIVHYVKGP